MISSLDPQSAKFLADINRVQARISDANAEVTSGKKITTPSDAPDQIGALLQLRADLQRNTQIQSNLSLAQTDANGADNAITSSIQLLDSALGLATQGASAMMQAGGRQDLALQIQAIQQQMVANSQTAVQGRYIFSGDRDGAPVFTWDLTAANPVVSSGTVQATRQIEDPAGGTFAASRTANDIFDDRDASGTATTNNVFNALSQLHQALLDNDTGQITNAITLVKSASEHLNSMQSFYGYVQNRIGNAADFATKYDVQLRTEISQKEDSDITNAILEMTQGNTQLQASFQMRAQMPHNTLFNYLG